MQIVAAIPEGLKGRPVRDERETGAVLLGEIVKARTEQLALDGGLVAETTWVGHVQQRYHFVRAHQLCVDPARQGRLGKDEWKRKFVCGAYGSVLNAWLGTVAIL